MGSTAITVSSKSDFTPCTSLSKDAIKEILIKMRMKASKTFPFLSDLIYSREFQLSDGTESWTDGKKIVIGVGLAAKMPNINRIWYEFVGLHETMHLVFQHLIRFRAMKGQRNEHILYNILADRIINEMILDQMATKNLMKIGRAHV